jgi:SAM-dependent methyltransferase
MPTSDGPDVGFEERVLLWAARESGVLDALATTAGTPTAVAREAGVTARAATVTVDALADYGYLQRVGDEYELTNRSLGFLTKRDLRSVGRVPHALDLFDLYRRLPETMATGETPDYPDDWVRNRLGAHAATDQARVRACVTAAVHAHPDATRVLDVAGGSGVYAREFAARGYDVTLVESAPVVDVVGPLLGPAPVEVAPGRLPDDETPAADDSVDLAATPGTVDLVFAVDFARRHSDAANRAFLSAARETLAHDGTVVLVDAVRGRSDDPGVGVEALATGRGGYHDESAVRAWFEDEGFESVALTDVPGADRTAVVGHPTVE